MRAAGQTHRAIGEALGGVPRSTVEGWTSRRRRTAVPVRIVAQLVDPTGEAQQTLRDARQVLREARRRSAPPDA